ncbi:protein snail homolog Sna-like [Scophthalmus maximus]|uniref:Zinc finger protein SNAI2 n=1 Tax=Scophthalmus maximus TaxID=52904 RepID=A0A8D2ZG29_SCOMX|nr:protein snail homolog Sna-like [Scophthalmus maximus]
MPRSFLVKTHQSSRRPSYKDGGARTQSAEAPYSTHDDHHHHRQAPSPRLQHRAQSFSSSSSLSSSSSSSSSCALSLRAVQLHLPPSANISTVSLIGPSLEAYSRSAAEAYKPAESCTQVNLEIQYVTGDLQRRESLLAPSLPLLALFPAVLPGGGSSGGGSSSSSSSSSSQESFECLDCHKEHLSFSGPTKHKQLPCEWSGKKYFSCKYCEKEYVSLGALKMHIRTHTLPCVCKLCGKAFSRPWLLQGHIRTHTGEKPFSCLHCSRAFADRSNLRAHLQTHSEVKKYQCASCLKTFSRISLLAKHQEAGCPVS